MPARRAPRWFARPADDPSSPVPLQRIVIALLAFGRGAARSNSGTPRFGGVLLFVALRIVRASQIVAIYRQSLGDFFLIAATAAAIVLLPIEQGVCL